MSRDLDAAAVRTWWELAVAALGSLRSELDRVNVFPVPDGDTGTNMYLTLRDAAPGRYAPAGLSGGCDAAPGRVPGPAVVPDAVPGTAGEFLAQAAGEALFSARGNSGTILSEYLRGFADAAHGAVTISPELLAVCLSRAFEAARAAVVDPLPGTILSAAADAAQAAQQAVAAAVGSGGNPAEGCLRRVPRAPSAAHPDSAPSAPQVAAAAAQAAWTATLNSPTQLALLADHGVVDAGAAGLWVVLDALRRALTGSGDLPRVDLFTHPARTAPLAVPAPGNVSDPPGTMAAAGAGLQELGHQEAWLPPARHREPEHPGAGGQEEDFEVMYVLDGGPDVREQLGRIGNCVVVGAAAGDVGGTRGVHVHTSDPVAAIRIGVHSGARVSDVRVRQVTPAMVRAVAVVASAKSVLPAARFGATVLVGPSPDWPGLTAPDVTAVVRAARDARRDQVPVLVGDVILGPAGSPRPADAAKNALQLVGVDLVATGRDEFVLAALAAGPDVGGDVDQA